VRGWGGRGGRAYYWRGDGTTRTWRTYGAGSGGRRSAEGRGRTPCGCTQHAAYVSDARALQHARCCNMQMHVTCWRLHGLHYMHVACACACWRLHGLHYMHVACACCMLPTAYNMHIYPPKSTRQNAKTYKHKTTRITRNWSCPMAALKAHVPKGAHVSPVACRRADTRTRARGTALPAIAHRAPGADASVCTGRVCANPCAPYRRMQCGRGEKALRGAGKKGTAGH
jgi:hypothetical protein